MSTDLHTLSGAYAIDALSSVEAAEFRKHLEGCPACRAEVAELQHAAARMGASTASRPPAELRARVMAAADQHPQLPPRVRRAGRVSPLRWTPRLLAAAAAVILIAAAGIGLLQLQHHDRDVMAAPVARVFKAPDAQKATVDTANGGRISVATSRRLREMAVDTGGLPALSGEQVYQLWAISGGTPASVGLLRDTGAGKAMELPAQGTTVAITIEPAGGSEQPTTQPIVVVDPSRV